MSVYQVLHSLCVSGTALTMCIRYCTHYHYVYWYCTHYVYQRYSSSLHHRSTFLYYHDDGKEWVTSASLMVGPFALRAR
jgi:hypothetical protein